MCYQAKQVIMNLVSSSFIAKKVKNSFGSNVKSNRASCGEKNAIFEFAMIELNLIGVANIPKQLHRNMSTAACVQISTKVMNHSI